MLAQASINQDNYVEDDSWESETSKAVIKDKSKEEYTLKVAVGPMWTISKMCFPDGSDRYGLRGYGMSLSYAMIKGQNWGFGFDAQYYRKNVTTPDNMLTLYKNWDYFLLLLVLAYLIIGISKERNSDMRLESLLDWSIRPRNT